MKTPNTCRVSGGAGFIGSHLIEALLKEGHRVISLDNYFVGSVENHIPEAEYRKGHTKDIALHIPETPDLVYHLGEYSRVEKSFDDLPLVWDLNMIGTFEVLEFCRKKGSKLVYAGSSTKFGDGGLGRDQSPYAFTKAMNTDLVKNYGTWFHLPYAITYFYNVYGPRERSNAYGTVIAIFTERAKQGKSISVVTPGTQRRNFTHVADIVSGLLLVGEKGQGEEYGLGAEESYSILEIAELFNAPIEMLPPRLGNRMESTLDTTKSTALGWKPVHNVKEYIASILDPAVD
jgi:UDP-glucose 4-epimerase